MHSPLTFDAGNDQDDDGDHQAADEIRIDLGGGERQRRGEEVPGHGDSPR